MLGAQAVNQQDDLPLCGNDNDDRMAVKHRIEAGEVKGVLRLHADDAVNICRLHFFLKRSYLFLIYFDFVVGCSALLDFGNVPVFH